AASQRTTRLIDEATRGPIVDRNGKSLAFTVSAKALTFQPVAERANLAEAREKNDEAPDPEQRLRDIARTIHEKLGPGGPKESELLDKLTSDESFVYLARSVDPRIATEIMVEFPEVG